VLHRLETHLLTWPCCRNSAMSALQVGQGLTVLRSRRARPAFVARSSVSPWPCKGHAIPLLQGEHYHYCACLVLRLLREEPLAGWEAWPEWVHAWNLVSRQGLQKWWPQGVDSGWARMPLHSVHVNSRSARSCSFACHAKNPQCHI
jgi:hypothetical protein